MLKEDFRNIFVGPTLPETLLMFEEFECTDMS
jgi:hypothetical protein